MDGVLGLESSRYERRFFRWRVDLRGEAEEASPHWRHTRAHAPLSRVYAMRRNSSLFSVINLSAVLPYGGL